MTADILGEFHPGDEMKHAEFMSWIFHPWNLSVTERMGLCCYLLCS